MASETTRLTPALAWTGIIDWAASVWEREVWENAQGTTVGCNLGPKAHESLVILLGIGDYIQGHMDIVENAHKARHQGFVEYLAMVTDD